MSEYNRRYKLHCPLCGFVLVEIARSRVDTDDWEWDDPRWGTLGNDQSYWLKCNKCKCFGEGYPLILHHPLGDLKSEPGDSWSLTWIK
jgi:hypothetical protein